MSTSEIAQFEKLVTGSSHILVLLPENPQGDYFCAALAIAHFCDLKSIKTTIAFTDPYEQISMFEFLPKPETTEVLHSIAGTRDLILSFNTKYNKILNVKTKQINNKFNIYVTPEKGMIDSRDFSFLPGKFPYDIIITIGATDKESMGILYEEIPDIFYELPIINIDNKSANDNFGQVNIVNVVASSTSEIIGDLFEKIHTNKLSYGCTQALLTGIISETHSFQNHKTTPRAMTLASRLIDGGADQQEIIKNLYRNLPFSLLQLWGRAMKNITISKYNKKTIISHLSHNDILETAAKKYHIHDILEKMKENYPAGKIFILFFQDDDDTFSALINMERSNMTLVDIDNITTLPNNTYTILLTAKNFSTASEEIRIILSPYIEQIK